MPIPTNKCKECAGTGQIGGEFHMHCLGTGEVVGEALKQFLKTQLYDDVMDKLNDIKEKVDEIKVVVDLL